MGDRLLDGTQRKMFDGFLFNVLRHRATTELSKMDI